MNKLEIRPALKNDIPEIMKLYRQLNSMYTSQDEPSSAIETMWNDISLDHRQQVLVAVHDDLVVGTITCIVIPNIGHMGHPWMALENLVVRDGCRGNGIGKILMETAATIAQRTGCYKMVLSTNTLRYDAHAFYEKLGWKQTHIGFSVNLK